METLYRSAWGDTSCLDQALQTIGIGVLALGIILPVIGAVLWWPFRKKPNESRLVLIVMAVVALLLLTVLLVWFSVFDRSLRAIRFGAAGFAVESCRGPWANTALHP